MTTARQYLPVTSDRLNMYANLAFGNRAEEAPKRYAIRYSVKLNHISPDGTRWVGVAQGVVSTAIFDGFVTEARSIEVKPSEVKMPSHLRAARASDIKREFERHDAVVVDQEAILFLTQLALLSVAACE